MSDSGEGRDGGGGDSGGGGGLYGLDSAGHTRTTT
jgi:hypothetical protein